MSSISDGNSRGIDMDERVPSGPIEARGLYVVHERAERLRVALDVDADRPNRSLKNAGVHVASAGQFVAASVMTTGRLPRTWS